MILSVVSKASHPSNMYGIAFHSPEASLTKNSVKMIMLRGRRLFTRRGM